MKNLFQLAILVCKVLVAVAFAILIDITSSACAQTNPVVNAFNFTPQSVDVSTQNATVTFTLNVTDPAGIQNVYVYLSSASYSTSVTMYDTTATPPVTSGLTGSLQNAFLSANLTVYGGTVPGPLTINNVYVRDFTGNVTSLATADLTTAGFPSVLTVIDNPAAPKLTGFSFAPSTVDVTNINQTVTFNVSAQDSNNADGYGIAYVLVSFIAPTSCLGPEAKTAEVYTPSAGSTANGVWTGQVTIPQNDVIGNWSAYVEVHDTSGAYLVFQAADLQTLGFQAFLTVTGPPNCASISDSICGTVHMCRLCGAGVSGVTLTLYNSSNTVVGATTSTSNGTYTFSGLMPGTYRVIESVPSGNRAISADAGTGSGGTVVSNTEISVVVVGSDTTFQPNDFVICPVCGNGLKYTTLCQDDWCDTAFCDLFPNCLHSHYRDVYPDKTCTIGGTTACCNFDCANAIENFLCQDGNGFKLPSGCYNNPTDNHLGCLVGDVLACKLNIDYSDCGIFRCGFKNLVCQTGPLKGCTVAQVCGVGNCLISGQSLPTGTPKCTAADVDSCLQQINTCYGTGSGSNDRPFCK